MTIHHFDVTRFFAQISNQQSTEPYFDLAGQIVYAQNKKDLKALDKIKQKIEKGEYSRIHYGLKMDWS